MSSRVLFKMGGFLERGVAFEAFEWTDLTCSVFRICSTGQMSVASVFVTKCGIGLQQRFSQRYGRFTFRFVTVNRQLALVFRHPLMRLNVYFEIISVAEFLVAKRALVWPLSAVKPKWRLEIRKVKQCFKSLEHTSNEETDWLYWPISYDTWCTRML